ncbi:hypothetical protein AAVH_24587 [Aphelenchoides avenae]|nr:hypothetical protein AAVH_24587 [Aphelenchus avenae]
MSNVEASSTSVNIAHPIPHALAQPNNPSGQQAEVLYPSPLKPWEKPCEMDKEKERKKEKEQRREPPKKEETARKKDERGEKSEKERRTGSQRAGSGSDKGERPSSHKQRSHDSAHNRPAIPAEARPQEKTRAEENRQQGEKGHAHSVLLHVSVSPCA